MLRIKTLHAPRGRNSRDLLDRIAAISYKADARP
jgi:hypothetical protein